MFAAQRARTMAAGPPAWFRLPARSDIVDAQPYTLTDKVTWQPR